MLFLILDPRSFFGPIFFKEMLVAGRRAFTHWARFGTGVLIAFFLWVIVAGEVSSSTSWSSGAARIQAYAQIAPMITIMVGVIVASILPVIASAFGAGSLLDEKSARTIDSLLATPMSAWSIVASKVTSRVIQLLILALIALPVLLGARAFGGLSIETVAAFFCVGVSLSVFACAVATWSSMRVQHAWVAMVSGVAVCVLLSAIPFAPALVGDLDNWSPSVMFGFMRVAVHTSPVGALVHAGLGSEFPLPVEFFDNSVWLLNSAFLLLLSLLVMMATASRVRRETVGKARSKIKRKKDGSVVRKAVHERTRSRTVVGHPVAWRAIRRPIFKGGRKLKIAAALILAGLLTFIYVQAPPTEIALHGTLTIFCFFIAVLMPLNSTTGVLTGEREARTLDVLLSTPLTARSILFSKLISAFPAPVCTLMLVVLHVLVYAVVSVFIGEDTVSPMLAVYTLIIGLGTFTMLGGTGILFGTLFRRNSLAMVANIGLWLTVWLLIPITFEMLDLFWRSDKLQNFVALTNPFFLVVDSVNGTAIEGWRSSGITYEFGESIDADFGPIGWTIFLGIWSGGAAIIGLGSTWVASFLLAKRTHRRA